MPLQKYLVKKSDRDEKRAFGVPRPTNAQSPSRTIHCRVVESPEDFFHRCTTGDNSRATHLSLKGCRDEYSHTGKWDFSSSEDEERLQGLLALFHIRNIPMYVIERKTPVFGLMEDFDIYGSSKVNLLSHQICWATDQREENGLSHMVALRALSMCKSFGWNEVEFSVFASSGFSTTHKVEKTSLHVSWKGVFVNQERALLLRKFFLEMLCEDFPKVEAELLALHSENTLEKVVDDSVLRSNGIRMPYSDKWNRSKCEGFGSGAPEGRVCLPLGTWKFKMESKSLEIVTKPEDIDPLEWIKRGSVRSAPETELLQWTEEMENYSFRNQLSTKRRKYEEDSMELKGQRTSMEMLGNKKVKVTRVPSEEKNNNNNIPEQRVTHVIYSVERLFRLKIGRVDIKGPCMFLDADKSEQGRLCPFTKGAHRNNNVYFMYHHSRDRSIVKQGCRDQGCKEKFEVFTLTVGK